MIDTRPNTDAQTPGARSRRLWIVTGVALVLLGAALLFVLQRGPSGADALTPASRKSGGAPSAAGVVEPAESEVSLPAQGVYQYAVDRRDGSKRSQLVVALGVNHLRGSKGEQGLMLAEDWQGTIVSRQYAVSASSWSEVAMTITRGDYKERCVWGKPYQLLPAPARVGSSWKMRGSCTLQVGGQSATLEMTGASRVQAGPTASVAGKKIGTVRIVRTITLRTFIGSRVGTRTSTVEELFAPSYGLVVVRVERGNEKDSKSAGAPKPFTETRTLQSLTPAR